MESCVSVRGKDGVWTDYMKRIMNEENVDRDTEGPVGLCKYRGGGTCIK